MSWAVWITGVPGSEKSVIVRAAVEAISAAGHAVELLELDEMRRLVTPRPTDTEVERNLVYRALVYVASRLVDAGIPVVIVTRRRRGAPGEISPAACFHDLRRSSSRAGSNLVATARARQRWRMSRRPAPIS